MKTDALGNEIVLGGLYGYSNRSQGIFTIVIGTAEKETEKGITIKIWERARGAYDGIPRREKNFTQKKVNVISNLLFPLESNYKTNWRDE